MKITASLFLLLLCIASCSKNEDTPAPAPTPTPLPTGQLYEYKIAPSVVNAAVTSFNSDNYIYLDTRVTAKNKLLVFFPGTSSAPFFYSTILKKAAALGYHTIGLMYPNNNDIYTYSTVSTDNSRYRLCRQEAFDGVDGTPGVAINNDNCIKTRLIKLLQYLQTQYPSQNWQQFYSGSNVDWSKLVLAGHSQGGGLALFISKQVSVERAVSFSSLDWNASLNTSADWVTMSGLTPVSKLYSFNHQSDEVFNYAQVQTQLTAMGLAGPQVNIDGTASPYSNSHTLNSLATPVTNVFGPNHSITCLDQYVPRTGTGEVSADYQRAWEYLLGK